MAGKAAAMTPTQVRKAGFAVLKMATTGSAAEAKAPWVIMGINGSPWSRRFVLTRYATYREAVAALHEDLTSPDGVLTPDHVSGPALPPPMESITDA